MSLMMQMRFLMQWACRLAIVFCWLPNIVEAQSEEAGAGTAISQRIRVKPGYMGIAIGDVGALRSSLTKLCKDWESEGGPSWGFYVPFFLPEYTGGTIDTSQGAIIYVPQDFKFESPAHEFVQLQLLAGEKPKQILKKKLLDLDDWMDAENFFKSVEVPYWLRFIVEDECQAKVRGQDLLLSTLDDREKSEAFWNSPLLNERLDKESLKVFDESGITFFGALNADSDLLQFNLDKRMEFFEATLAESELIWLKRANEIFRNFIVGLFSLKYIQKNFVRVHLGSFLDDNESLAELVDLKAVRRDWRPGLGLEAKDLLVAGSIQLDAFPSSAATRVLPQLVMTELAQEDEFQFLQGNILQLATEIAGDSWNDLDAARVALYQNRVADEAVLPDGEFLLVGILDTKDPVAAMEELRFLTSVKNPMMAAERSDLLNDEIQSLIKDLLDEGSNVWRRAETRLRWIGPAAIPDLERAIDAGDRRLRRRGGRTLASLQRLAEQDKQVTALSDPWFWSTLNPGFEMQEAQGKIANRDFHVIEITPDPSKTERELEQINTVMRQLFGSQWNRVKLVQVDEHMIFVLGSNDARLQRIMGDVQEARSPIFEQFEKQGLDPQSGPLQCYFCPARVSHLLGFAPAIKGTSESPDRRMACASMNFRERALLCEILMPIEQIIPFLQQFGF